MPRFKILEIISLEILEILNLGLLVDSRFCNWAFTSFIGFSSSSPISYWPFCLFKLIFTMFQTDEVVAGLSNIS